MAKLIQANQLSDALRDSVAQMLDYTSEECVVVAKGFAPVDTGTLRDSIVRKIEEQDILIVAEAPYSLYVEEGTQKMAPQPFMRQTIDSFPAILKRSIDKVK